MTTRHRTASIVFVAIVLLTAAALAQRQPASQAAGRARAGRMPAVTAATHNNHPALAYQGVMGNAYIDYFTFQGEPALGFTMAQDQCRGHVYVTRTRVAGDFRGTPCKSFDLTRDETTVDRGQGSVVLKSGDASYTLTPLVEMGTEQRPAPRAQVMAEMLARAVRAFGKTFANVRRAGMELQGQPQTSASPQQPTSLAAAAKQMGGTLHITSDPGDAQVFVNGEQRGSTGEDGHASVPLPAGNYRVRVSLPGYKDFEQAVTLAAGAQQEVKAQLEAEGPPPFSESDISEMLKGEMSPKRVTTLVQLRGVNFALNADLEKQLRGMGATSDLLLAIATNKK